MFYLKLIVLCDNPTMSRDRISQIENWREEHDLSKADLARYFKVDNQTYNNWTYRQSLPKEHYDSAEAILGDRVKIVQEGKKVQIIARHPSEVREPRPTTYNNNGEFDFSVLSEQELAQVIKAALPSLSPDGKKALLHALIDDLL